MANEWTDLLNPAELAARTAFTATLDPAFAAREKAFYEGRTAAQLRSLVSQAWNATQAESYQVARSYLALKTERVCPRCGVTLTEADTVTCGGPDCGV